MVYKTQRNYYCAALPVWPDFFNKTHKTNIILRKIKTYVSYLAQQ